MRNLNKTYKFVYWYYSSNMTDKVDSNVMTYGNRMPADMNQKMCVYSFFFNSPDRVMRGWFTDRPTRVTKSEPFLTRDMPATEANIVKAFVQYYTKKYNQSRRRLTYVNKHPEKFQHTGHNAIAYRKDVKSSKKQLAYWKQRYQTLKDQGVYTYLELMK